MSYEVAFTDEASQQIVDLEDYLAERFSSVNAERYIDRLTLACLSLGKAPHRGTMRDDLKPGIRVIGFERRVAIYFTAVEKRVVILGILYAGRAFTPPTDE